MNITDKLFQMKEEKAAANLKAGQEFLAANKLKPGVTELPSGLQYEIITEGTGPKRLIQLPATIMVQLSTAPFLIVPYKEASLHRFRLAR